MTHMMSSQPGVLLLSFPPARSGLGDRLQHMGFATRSAEGLDEAVALVRHADPPVGAVMLPWPIPIADPPEALRLLREVSQVPTLRFVVLGSSDAAERAPLRDAIGLGLTLAEPFTETELRFVVNYALYNATQGEARRVVRVPTRMLARIRAGTGEKDVLVYSLSEDGAFLETPRPSQPGSSLELELPLPTGSLRAPAQVLAANVPGSSYRRHVPKGMGVRFAELGAEARERLERYIEQRARSFQF